MKFIRRIQIPTADLSSATHILPLTISGDEGATFSVIMKKNTTHWYDFDSSVDAFVTSEKILSNIVIGSNELYTTNINIPTASSTTVYSLLVIADTNSETSHVGRTEFRATDGSIDENRSIGSDSAIVTKTINQFVNTVITISGVSHAKASDYGDAVGTALTISIPRKNSSPFVNFTKTFGLSASNFIKARDPKPTDFESYFQATILDKYTGGSDGTTEFYLLNEEDIARVSVGMTVRSSGITGSTTISEIEKDGQSNTITFSTTEGSVSSGDDLNIYGGGNVNIDKVHGTTLSFQDLSLVVNDVVTTINDTDCNGTASLTVFDVTSATGIKDDFSTVHGVNITTPPTVTNISSNTLTVSAAQVLQNGQTLNFKGASRSATLRGRVSITKAGESDFTLFFNLDNVLTVS